MEMKGEERIAAHRDAVWAALNDPDILKQCIPGCHSITRTSPTEFSAALKVKIGPIPVMFTGQITLSNVQPTDGSDFGHRVRKAALRSEIVRAGSARLRNDLR